MTTHVPEDATARLLLDGEAIAKSLSRIAHEIIERNGEAGSSRAALRWPHGSAGSSRSEAASSFPSARSTSRSIATTCT